MATWAATAGREVGRKESQTGLPSRLKTTEYHQQALATLPDVAPDKDWFRIAYLFGTRHFSRMKPGTPIQQKIRWTYGPSLIHLEPRGVCRTSLSGLRLSRARTMGADVASLAVSAFGGLCSSNSLTKSSFE